MYRQVESIYKQKIRDLLWERIVSYLNIGNAGGDFLTLPNKSFDLEENILKWLPMSKIDCYEIDKEIFSKIKRITQDGRVTFYNENVLNSIRNTKYSFVWLDLCNSYTEEIVNKIIECVQSITFAQRAILAITMKRSRGRSGANLLFNSYYENYKDNGFGKHIGHFINTEVIDIERVEYKCSDTSVMSSSMNLFIFKLLSNERRVETNIRTESMGNKKKKCSIRNIPV